MGSVLPGKIKADLVTGAVIGAALYGVWFLLEESRRPPMESALLLLLATLAGAAGYVAAGVLVRLVSGRER